MRHNSLSSGRLRILLSAYACEPEKGSEEAAGWNMAREMAKRHEVWVITRSINRPSIEAQIARAPVPGLHFVYFDLPLMARWRMLTPGVQVGLQLYYYLWQICVYLKARRLHRKVRFDLAHHITYGKYWGPSFLALLPIPFIWGPVGGGESTPWSFWRDFSLQAKAYEALRDLARWVGEHDPFVRLTARRSVSALATTEETAARLRRLGAREVEVFPQSGLLEEEVEQLGRATQIDTTPVRFISVGRLLHWKGFHLGLRAFAQAPLSDAEYWIVGEGVERDRLENLTKELRIENRVRFWGALSRDETLNKLKECNILVHPSLHDSSPWVCPEAMAAGRPIICLHVGGPAIQVTEETGVRVPIGTPEQSVKAMAEAMSKVASNRNLCRWLGEQGKKRVESSFTWNIKADNLEAIYHKVLNPSRTR